MANYIYLNDVLQPLSHSLGEESIPNPVPTSRLNAVQYAVERVSRLYDFDWTKDVFSVTLASGAAALPTGLRTDANLDVRQVVSGTDNDFIFDEVTRNDFDSYNQGDYKYYLSYAPSTTGMAATIVTTESNQTIQITGSVAAPVISTSVGVSFPSAKVLSDFALVYVRRSEDKDADTSVEEAIAQQGLQELVAAEQRNNPTGKARNRYDKMNKHTGDVGNGFATHWGV